MHSFLGKTPHCRVHNITTFKDFVLKLRKQNFIVKYDYKYNLKKSLKEANELNIKFAIIIGENETQNNVYTVKNLLNGNQTIVNYEELTNVLNS